MDGFLVIDKPAGITSHDVVQRVRRLCRQKKVGHTGTLDPFATGVLPVALGEATKAIFYLDEGVKEYRAELTLGKATDTQDCTGTVVGEGEWREVTAARLSGVAQEFTGRISQVPPMYSALKRDGVPLYRLARAGTVVERQPRQVEIFALAIERLALPAVEMTVVCSRGTYVRTLAADLGERLGCGAHLTALRRTRSGPFTLARAITLEQLAELADGGELASRLLTACQALDHLPEFPLTEEGMRKVGYGIAPAAAELAPPGAMPPAGGRLRLTYRGRLAALAEVAAAGGTALLRVFN